MTTCPLCFNEEIFAEVNGPGLKVFKGCSKCKLLFAETRFLPSAESEKETYLAHKNGIQYEGYVNFLNQAIEPSLPLLRAEMQGLDFGCGPVPTLSVILEQRGHKCDNYDPLFFPDIPKEKYDYIFATECFEHFFSPAKEIQLIKRLLKPEGILIVMTETWKSVENFADWYYVKDPTHVTFYNAETFNYIASEYNFDIHECSNERVFILKNDTV